MNQKEVAPPAQIPGHILLVDDDEFMVELIGDMLRDFGVDRVTTAHDGGEGLDVLKRGGALPDMVICDINMPNTDGFQMMEMMAKEHSECAFALVSALNSGFIHSATLMAKFHHLNILGVLHKPVAKEALAALLDKWRSQACRDH
jgi:CheY-like chemotaxis protein